MNRLTLTLTLVLLAGAGPRTLAADADGAASAMIARMVERLGGADAIADVRSLAVEADCDGPGGGFRTWIDSFRPGYAYFRQESSDGKTELWTTPDRSWHRDADGNAKDVPPGVRSFVRNHEFHLLLFELETRFSDHRTTGPSQDGDRPCTRIAMTDEDGHPAAICLAEDGLPLVLEMNPPGAEGPLGIRFADWDSIDGVSYFRSFVLSEGPDREFSYRYEKIEPNTVSALRFVPPTASERRAEFDAILSILRDDRRAHLETNAELLASHIAGTLIAVSGGEVATQTRDQVLEFFTSYFEGATYSIWEDTRPPSIRVSDDAKMAWVARSVRARRVGTDRSGAKVERAFTSAYTSTYEKQDGGWKLTSVTSTFPPS